MVLLDLLKSLSTKHLKAVIRLHNLHEYIKLGQPRDALINDLIKHFDVLNANTLVSKIHELTIPQTKERVKRTKPVVEAVAVVKRKLTTPITKRIKAIAEPVIEEPVKRDLTGLISSLKSIRDVKKQGEKLVNEAKADVELRREKKKAREELKLKHSEELKLKQEKRRAISKAINPDAYKEIDEHEIEIELLRKQRDDLIDKADTIWDKAKAKYKIRENETQKTRDKRNDELNNIPEIKAINKEIKDIKYEIFNFEKHIWSKRDEASKYVNEELERQQKDKRGFEEQVKTNEKEIHNEIERLNKKIPPLKEKEKLLKQNIDEAFKEAHKQNKQKKNISTNTINTRNYEIGRIPEINEMTRALNDLQNEIGSVNYLVNKQDNILTQLKLKPALDASLTQHKLAIIPLRKANGIAYSNYKIKIQELMEKYLNSFKKRPSRSKIINYQVYEMINNPEYKEVSNKYRIAEKLYNQEMQKYDDKLKEYHSYDP